MKTVINAAPHPDDELIGAGATLMLLRDAGWRVVNVACGLGRPADHGRRRAELEEACRRARFVLEVPRSLPPLGRGDDLAQAQGVLAELLREAIHRHQAPVIVGPSPDEAHHGHAVVGRAVLDAAAAAGGRRRVMLWGVWSDLASPNVIVGFDDHVVGEVQAALSAHAGELARNDYDRLVRARAEMNAVLGAERVFGFGSARVPYRYAELLRELIWEPERGWIPTEPHELDPAARARLGQCG